MGTTDTAARLRDFITDDLLMGEGAEFGPDDLLLEEGIIDSLGLLEIVTFIETEFDVVVEDEDVTLDAFGSLRAMAVYLDELLNGGRN